MKNDELDRWIARALERAEEEAPDHFREAARRRVAAMGKAKPFPWRTIFPWLPLAAAAVLVVAFTLRVDQPPPAAEKPITRIRTEFSIPERNIRIVWVQRDDFRLPGENG